MLRTFKYRLYPTPGQTDVLESWLEKLRLLYNFALAKRRDAWKGEGRSIGYREQQNALPRLKCQFPEYADIHSQVLQDCLGRLQKAFDSFFRRLKDGGKKPGYPRFKGRGRYGSFTYPQSGFGLVDEGRSVRLSGIGDIRLVYHRPIPETGRIKTCTISRNRGDQWFVSFCVELPDVEIRSGSVEIRSGSVVGVDLGLTNLITLSSGEVVAPPACLRKAQRRLGRIQRRHSRKQKGSQNRARHRLKLGKAHVKVANQRLDFLHKLSNTLTENHEGLAFEDLNISGLVKNPRLAKSILDASWGTLVRLTAYKAESAGKPFVLVPPHYTSQDCSHCKERVPKTLAQRLHRCPNCGVVLGRDHNAALNIASKATAGTAESYAWGDKDLYGGCSPSSQVRSANQEAPPVRAG